MKVSDTPGGDSVVAYVITGNGRAEYEILPPLAKKYNERRHYCFRKLQYHEKLLDLKCFAQSKWYIK